MSRKEMNVSVVISTFNRQTTLASCLAAVCEQDCQAQEIIVVDDASTDDTGEMIARLYPQVRYICLDTNRGPAAARNRGIAAASGQIVAFTDDDCIVPASWLKQLVAGFAAYPGVAGVGGYQEPPSATVASNVFARTERERRLRRWGERAHTPQLGGEEIPGLATNNVAYRRQILLQLDGFDESFPVAAGEDADLKRRVAEQHQLLYLPLPVMHIRSYTLRDQWELALRRGKGVYYFEKKHGPPPGTVRVLMRLLKRTLQFLNDLRVTRWDVAAVIYLTAAADALGQLQMVWREKRR